jgi:hypothetical protein
MKLAQELNLSYTPCLHLIHLHAVDIFRKHGGFGELLEDSIEQSHQTMLRLHRRLAGLGSCSKRAEAISRFTKRVVHPIVKECMEKYDRIRNDNYKLGPPECRGNWSGRQNDRRIFVWRSSPPPPGNPIALMISKSNSFRGVVLSKYIDYCYG